MDIEIFRPTKWNIFIAIILLFFIPLPFIGRVSIFSLIGSLHSFSGIFSFIVTRLPNMVLSYLIACLLLFVYMGLNERQKNHTKGSENRIFEVLWPNKKILLLAAFVFLLLPIPSGVTSICSDPGGCHTEVSYSMLLPEMLELSSKNNLFPGLLYVKTYLILDASLAYIIASLLINLKPRLVKDPVGSKGKVKKSVSGRNKKALKK